MHCIDGKAKLCGINRIKRHALLCFKAQNKLAQLITDTAKALTRKTMVQVPVFSTSLTSLTSLTSIMSLSLALTLNPTSTLV